MNALDGLTTCAGSWRGTNTLHDPSTGKPEESPSTLNVPPVLGSRFVRVDYTWGYRGKPQEGSLLIGFDPKTGEVSGYWIDSWRVGRKAMSCLGTILAGSAISIKGSYAAPPGPDWGWKIEIAPMGDSLRVMHTNIDPDEKAERAADGVYARE